jgi:predicted transcriptional regulator YdeE
LDSVQIGKFKIVGISIRTTNKNNQSVEDLGKLWNKFYTENISGKITNKESEEIYSIYTDYKSNYKEEYTCIIGMKVKSFDEMPSGLINRELDGGKYLKFVAGGEMPKAVIKTWEEIWKRDKELQRKYTADFEVYGRKANDGNNSEVEIFVATK